MIALLALGSIIEFLLLVQALLAGAASIYWFAPMHLALTIAALLLTMRKLRGMSALQCFALPIGAAMGPPGMLFCLLIAPLAASSRRKRQIVYNNVRIRRYRIGNSLSPVERLGRILDDRIRYPDCDEIGSLATMLRYGSLQARYRALETAVISFEPRLSPLIVMALSDEDQTIRALAAAAAAQVSYNLAQQSSELQARIAPSQNLDDRYALAMLFADHGCFNQLLPQSQRTRLCQEAGRKLDEIAEQLSAADIRRRALREVRAHVGRAMERDRDAQSRSLRNSRMELSP
ncbi:hypothetical protein CAF53_16050 [Sphingobium sp. LB126]|uniref:hypothetical protein n=1 Tax=Sphingobium sp. LB126 TaxID=1983755 RepID=UPI000C20C02E|nr:hypothetical protein [Sphingobium sp. LB126]PJG49552.1 hypothetical protein CAF53_16050 [Sphingobium sp. LB126]